MPKKTRRMKQRASLRRSVGPETEPEVSVATPPVAPRPEVNRGVAPLTFDYAHIYADLKRILFFALFFFSLLVVLSFVIK